MHMIRGHLPLEFTLSEGGGPLEKRDVNPVRPVATGGFRHFLDHHLPHKWDRDPSHTMNYFFRAAHLGSFKIGTVRRIEVGKMVAALGNELLEAQCDEVGHPMFQTIDHLLRWTRGAVFQLPADVEQQVFETFQSSLNCGEALLHV